MKAPCLGIEKTVLISKTSLDAGYSMNLAKGFFLDACHREPGSWPGQSSQSSGERSAVKETTVRRE
jgi:hypothetical protein